MTTHSTAPAAPQRPPHRPRHRWLALVVVALLIAIPAGYLALSAYQSRDSGEDKARTASAQALIYEWPSKVQRRIYDVPIPAGSAYVGYYETNSWDVSKLYVEFRCSPGQLSGFLHELGIDPSDLREGRVSVSDADADIVGWSFDEPDRTYTSATVQQSDAEPEVAVTVDTTSEERPRVYVTSTAHL
ncbi:hypothetical protein [Streptomyces sp. RFCAC02]|uniref:hypothetical protein n=1 Tax=Streptomyces sp. RFCAC02 TaxID=2499143 RepID=UPI00101FD558|nr:hypothetical protein [Streptomyces sp. RFCAC02]